MSYDTCVFLNDDRLPAWRELQRALDELGAGLVLDDVNDLRAHTGFWPMKHKGHDSGAEWFYDSVAEALHDVPEETGGRTHMVSLVTHSEMRELVCAMYVAAALVKFTDGVGYDPQEAASFTIEEALASAREAEAEEL